ncbi:hypothetical protein I4U23_023643 [Adineta vaga]|nr:hypothetical protein I4U23_023643 [Adineta vaga]
MNKTNSSFPTIKHGNTFKRNNKINKISRRPTIISPTGHIRSYNCLRFVALILCGCLLSFIGGYINTICIANFYRISVSAFTGVSSKIAIELVQGNFIMTLHYFILILSFIFGSFISAAVVGGSSFRIDRSYGLVLLLESSALALGYLLEKTTVNFIASSASLHIGAYMMSLACGLQNGMCTTFSGAVIRTTHVTGILTDIGLILGQATFYSRTRKHLWKLEVLIPLYLSFCLGGIIGYLMYQILLLKAILLPTIIIGVFDHVNGTSNSKDIVDGHLNNDYDKQNDTPLIEDLHDISIHNLKSNTTVLYNNSFAIMSGSKDAGLILTNGEPQVTETTFIWFDNDRVQRLANILCFSGSSCGLDLLKQLYREKFRSFGYETIQSTLAKQLYSSTAVSSELTCADPTGASVSCTNGFCRSAFDGNGLVSYSSCIKNGIVPAPYGLVVSKSTMADIDIEQSTIMYSCNKPMCNSIENTRQVLQQLIAAKLIPQSTGTTTTPKNTGIQLMKNYQEMFVSFLMIFLIFKI